MFEKSNRIQKIFLSIWILVSSIMLLGLVLYIIGGGNIGDCEGLFLLEILVSIPIFFLYKLWADKK